MNRLKKWFRETGIRIKMESPKYFKRMGRIGASLTTISIIIQVYPDMHHAFMDAFKIVLGIGAGMVWVSVVTVSDREELLDEIRTREFNRERKKQMYDHDNQDT